MGLFSRLVAVGVIAQFAASCPAYADEGMGAVSSSEVGVLADGVSDAAIAVSDSVAPLSTTLQPVNMWPESEKDLGAPLLAYPAVAEAAKNLLGDKYEAWAAFLAVDDKPVVFAPGLVKADGCAAAQCDMNKSLLVAELSQHKVYVALVENGRVTMRPSLMSWPDEAIAPLKEWLSSFEGL